MNRTALTCASTALALWIMIPRADAGTFASTRTGIISYKGDVVEGDDVTLTQIIAAMKARGVTPRLLSMGQNGGGNTGVSMAMAATLRRENIDTEVYARCPSACVTIFAGGVHRTLTKPGTIEVHSARDGSTEPGAAARESELSRANTVRLVRFLRLMDVPYVVVGKLVGTPPALITNVDDDELELWGVEIRR